MTLGQMVGKDERTDGVIDARTHLKQIGSIVDRPTDGPTDGHSFSEFRLRVNKNVTFFLQEAFFRPSSSSIKVCLSVGPSVRRFT